MPHGTFCSRVSLLSGEDDAERSHVTDARELTRRAPQSRYRRESGQCFLLSPSAGSPRPTESSVNDAPPEKNGRPVLLPGPGPVDRETVKRAGVAIVLTALIGLAFIGSYVGALHDPQPHGVELAVDGSSQLEKQLGRGGSFAVKSVGSRAAAMRWIDNRQVYGAVLEGARSDEVLVAGAAGFAVAETLSQTLPVELRALQGPRTVVAVADVKPLPPTDSRGTSAFYLVVGLVVASYIGAAFLGLVFGTKPVGRRVWWRLLGVGEVAVTVSLLGVALVHAIGPLGGHYLALVAASVLLCLTVGSVAVGLQSALGVVGTGLIIQLFVVLGNPSSGGAYATELLPGFWRAIGPDLPRPAVRS